VLRLDGHNYSPAVLAIILDAAARLPSHQAAAYAVGLTGVSICPRHVGRLATEFGTELAAQRDDKAARQRARQLPTRVAAVPEVVAVEIDGGRLRTRAPDAGPGVHQPQAKEDKIACLVSLQSSTYADDPQPEPPPALVEPRRVQRLVRQVHGSPGDMVEEEEGQGDTQQAAAAAHERTSPRKRVRTCVASLRDSHAFGPMVAAEAQERGFYQARRAAFVCDGLGYNWWIHQAYFKDFEPVVDLLHVVCYLYLAAWAAGGTRAEQWSRYLRWLRWTWCSQVHEVIAELEGWQRALQARLGEPPEGEELDEYDPRRLVAEARRYLGNNAGRMDYVRYRKAGLPVTSSLVESLVGEFNARVKGRGKFWDRLDGQGGEAMLQLRAAVLSEDDRLARYFAQRPGNPYRRRQPAKGGAKAA
jgi:hypothetical protein